MKPIININDLDNFVARENGPFKSRYARVGAALGAKKLGYGITILEPGKKVCPFHNHHVNEEMFLILEGSGTLRFGEETYAIKQHDIIACPPGGREVAHQIINTGDAPMKYLSLSTAEPVDICEYPDSNKVLSVAAGSSEQEFRHVARLEDAVEYFYGEDK